MSQDIEEGEMAPPTSNALNFPPLTRAHILHCSYHYWYPLYRSLTPKARIVPLSESFINYLRADRIILPPDDDEHNTSDDDSWTTPAKNTGSSQDEEEDSEDEEDFDPSSEWPEVHAEVKAKIAELGGTVAPKLNWSAPQDAKWMIATNDMQCRTANDVYLLLKSSNFITHDLEHAFDDCVPHDNTTGPRNLENGPRETTEVSNNSTDTIPYHLVLRKHINMNTALEFRCFVRNRQLICLSQRDMIHYDYLSSMKSNLLRAIEDFFETKLKDTFPDPDFVFDVYVPPPHKRVWLLDINPFAEKTDPLLFSWKQILDIEAPDEPSEEELKNALEGQVVRLSIRDPAEGPEEYARAQQAMMEFEDEAEDSDVEEIDEGPLFRLMPPGNPAGANLNSSVYSAHKLPKDVVDASRNGPAGMSEFLGQWKDIMDGKLKPDIGYSSDED